MGSEGTANRRSLYCLFRPIFETLLTCRGFTACCMNVIYNNEHHYIKSVYDLIDVPCPVSQSIYIYIVCVCVCRIIIRSPELSDYNSYRTSPLRSPAHGRFIYNVIVIHLLPRCSLVIKRFIKHTHFIAR